MDIFYISHLEDVGMASRMSVQIGDLAILPMEPQHIVDSNIRAASKSSNLCCCFMLFEPPDDHLFTHLIGCEGCHNKGQGTNNE